MDFPIYVDVNILVWLGGHPSLGEAAYRSIKEIEGVPRGEYTTSSLTLYETLVIIAGLTGRNLKDRNFAEEVINSMMQHGGLVIEPLRLGDISLKPSI